MTRSPAGYSIDSRTIRPGELFFAVKGEKMDGHDFVGQALEKGAVAAVVASEKLGGFSSKAGLSRCRRHAGGAADSGQVRPAIVGKAADRSDRLGGKDYDQGGDRARFVVAVSRAEVGGEFQQSFWTASDAAETGAGTRRRGGRDGDVARWARSRALAQIAQPETGVVTNVAPVHLEFFSSVAEIARAKYELIESLPADGTAVLNADDEYVSQFGRDFKGRVITYGFAAAATVRAENVESLGEKGSAFDIVVGDRRESATLPLVGSHNVYNALAATAVALERGLTLSEVASSLATLSPADKRGQVVRIGNITVINDCYNSNPKALAAMVDALAAMPARRRIVVAGEMLELGPQGDAMHRESGRHIADKKIDVLIGVRGLASQAWWKRRGRPESTLSLSPRRKKPENGWLRRRVRVTWCC